MGALDCILGDFGKATSHDGARRATFEQRLSMRFLPCCTRVRALRPAAPAQQHTCAYPGRRAKATRDPFRLPHALVGTKLPCGDLCRG